jgi:hypothetical protein
MCEGKCTAPKKVNLKEQRKDYTFLVTLVRKGKKNTGKINIPILLVASQ